MKSTEKKDTETEAYSYWTDLCQIFRTTKHMGGDEQLV